MTASPDGPTTDTQRIRLLIVEDDRDIGESLEEFFSMRDYDVDRTTTGEEALQKITLLPPYDVVLLDVMLPEKDGFEVLREARQSGVDSPVILLTAKSEDEHKLRGFDLGADDYVTKPFDAEELAARVQAVHKRNVEPERELDDRYTFGDLTIDFVDETATQEDGDVDLTDLEFDILSYLIKHHGRTVSRQQLLRDVWGISGDITTRTIDRHVASLRKKIEADPDNPELIETVYGVGYKFVG